MQRTVKLLEQLILKYETNLGVPHRKSVLQEPTLLSDESVFSKLDIRVGYITEVWKHPQSDKLWCEKIDVGQETPIEVGTGLQQKRTKEEMLGLVLVVANLPTKQLAGFDSHGMVLCVAKGEAIYPLRPPEGSIVGERVVLQTQNPPGKSAYLAVLEDDTWTSVLPHLHTNAQGEASFGDIRFLTSAGVVTSPLTDSKIS